MYLLVIISKIQIIFHCYVSFRGCRYTLFSKKKTFAVFCQSLKCQWGKLTVVWQRLVNDFGAKAVSLPTAPLLTSQCITVLQYLVDRLGCPGMDGWQPYEWRQWRTHAKKKWGNEHSHQENHETTSFISFASMLFFLWRLTFKASHFKPVDPHKSPESSSTLVLWGLWVKLQLKEVQRDKKLHATCCCCQGPCSFCVKLLWGKDMNLGCKSPEIRSKLSVEVLAQQHLALKVKLHWLYLVLSKSHVPRCQHCVCSVSGPLRSQLLHPSCKHTTWCATAGCWCYCRTAKCFQRRSWVCWILEPNCHWRCPWTAGRCGHHPTSLGSRLGERRGRVPGQLHRLPCWWQQQHRGREEVEEGCPGDLRQVRCGCYHYSSHQRQRLHARLRRQAGPRWHRGPSR